MSTTTARAHDEARAPDGEARPAWADLLDGLDRLGPAGLDRTRVSVERALAHDGVTYSAPPVPGTDLGSQVDAEITAPQRWHLDPVPLVVDPTDWAVLERGVSQRSAVLDAVLADLYGPQDLLRRRLVPPELVYGHDGYLRPAHGIALPGPRQLLVHAVDVGRTADGGYVALADRTQAPSGIGYALADRSVLARVLPEPLRGTAPRRLGAFAEALRTGLLAVAPEQVEQPRVVVLSPGSHSETAFDQAYLAALLGIPLVEGADLTVHQGRLWMRSLGTLEQVDVVLRRVDAAYCDPLDLRPDSRLGVVGLVEAARRGSVSIVNPLGSGVLENPGLLTLLPALCKALLGEPLALPSTPLFWCGRPAGLSHTLAHLDEMVLRPIGSGRAVVPSRLPAAEREQWRDRLRAEGWRWVGEVPLPLSEAPSATRSGLTSRPVSVRLFTVGGEAGHVVMPGGLGAVFAGDDDHPAWQERALTAAKDVWVPALTTEQAVSRTVGTPVVVPAPRPVREAVSSPRLLADLFWLGRYAERTEALTRALAATLRRSTDAPPGAAQAASQATSVLLTALGAVTGAWRTPTPQQLASPVGTLRGLTAETARNGTAAQAFGRLVQLAGAVRDQLSVDTWGVLADAEEALEALRAERVTSADALARGHGALLSVSLALSGLAAENMVRDPGWYLMDAGRRVERAQQLTVLLRAALVTPTTTRTAEVLLLESLLGATESVLTYRRRYRGELDAAAVLDLLLLDAGNPRALVFQLQSLAADLHALPSASGTSRPERLLEELLASVRRLDPADLAAVDGAGVRAELDSTFTALGASLRELADVITRQHLTLTEAHAQPAEYGGGGW